MAVKRIRSVLAVVVTHNSADHLPTALDSLAAQISDLTDQLDLGMRIRIVDSGSSDATLTTARRWALIANACQHLDVEVVDLGHNGGYAAAINRGRQDRRPREALLVMNPDVELGPGALGHLLAALELADVGIAAPRLVDHDHATRPSRRREPSTARALGEAVWGDHWPRRSGRWAEIMRDPLPDDVSEVDWATGALLMISPACDDAVGPWNERFFLYGEEVDHARRARASGFRILYVGRAVVHHSEGGSGRSPDHLALESWNRVRYAIWSKGVIAGLAAWIVAVLHAGLRSRRPEHRRVLTALLSPRRSPERLIASLRTGAAR